MPIVKEVVRSVFGKDPSNSVNPDGLWRCGDGVAPSSWTGRRNLRGHWRDVLAGDLEEAVRAGSEWVTAKVKSLVIQAVKFLTITLGKRAGFALSGSAGKAG